jgi:2-oxoglutarate dehydrogenase E1 component
MSGTFEELLSDVNPPPVDEVERVIFCSGKVAFDLMAERDRRGAKVAIARVEQLYPWPFAAVKRQLDTYPNARDVRWVQEEPENMGPWNAIKGRLYEAHGDTHDIHRVSRFESGSPACGSGAVHAQELEVLLEEALS